MASQELTATFTGDRHVFMNDGGAQRVIIADAETADRDTVTIKGECHAGGLKQGLDYRFYGRWVDHHKHGRQFAFTSFVMETPAGKRAVVTYLQQCNGIGYVVADRIWKEFGDKSVEQLRVDPGSVSAVVKGLTPAKARDAAEFLTKNEATERAKMDLMDVLHGRGFPKKTLDLVLRDFGSAAADRVKHNPYILMRYPGCGFIGTDRLWIQLGKPASRLKRQALCGWYAVARDSSGDTWFPIRRVRDGIEQEVAGVDLRVDDAIELSVRGRILGSRKDSGTRWFAEAAKGRSEGTVARVVGEILSEKNCADSWPDVNRLDLSDHQCEKVECGLKKRFGILSGGPGTGKTHSTAEIIKLLLASGWRGDEIAVCAPTGKAAVRITEAMQVAGVPLAAKTIHSLLGVESNDNGGWTFTHGASNPLPYQFIFLDEASMLDCTIAASFFNAIDLSTFLLIVGDVNQLPPVGHGAPLSDLIAAGVPTGELTEIRRNSGRIVQACKEIREAHRFTSSEKLDLENGENLLHVEVLDADQQTEILNRILGEFQQGSEYDEIWDVQVLVPLNKKGPLSRKELNKRLQLILNPTGSRCNGNPFRVRDKIINTKNGWFPSVDPTADGVNGEGKVYVANGEQGEVCEVEPNRTVAKLASPDRLIVIPRGTQDDTGDGSDEEDAENSDDKKTNTGCSWELGYAISVHKSQGSEWPVVIVVVDESSAARMVQSRNWFYTAISRAKKFCITLGKRDVIREMMRRDGARRKTLLVERIGEEVTVIERRRVAESAKRWDWADVLEGVA